MAVSGSLVNAVLLAVESDESTYSAAFTYSASSAYGYICCSYGMWDVKGNRTKGKSKEARDINLVLDNIKAQIIKHY